MTSDNERLVEQVKTASGLSNQVEDNQRRIQALSNNYELEISKLQGLLRSKQEEKDQFVTAHSKLIKAFEVNKRENGSLKADNLKLRDKLDKIKLQHVPSELKQELEKELDLLRTENSRLRDAYSSLEVERNKWRVQKKSILWTFTHFSHFRNLWKKTPPIQAHWPPKLQLSKLKIKTCVLR